MSRPPKNPGELCSYAELAVVGGAPLTKRDVQHLMEAKDQLIPPGRKVRAIKRFAMIGAIMMAGISQLNAARLAKTLVEREFNQEDGEAPTGLKFLAREHAVAIVKWLPAEASETNDFHYHLALRSAGPEVYRPGTLRAEDVLLEIIDHHVVQYSTVQSPKTRPVGWINNWGERGTELRMTHVSEKLTDLDPNAVWSEADVKSRQAYWRSLEAEARRVRENAVAKVTINLSLAIRNGFDRLYDERNHFGPAS
jgi:hypothetical protein